MKLKYQVKEIMHEFIYLKFIKFVFPLQLKVFHLYLIAL